MKCIEITVLKHCGAQAAAYQKTVLGLTFKPANELGICPGKWNVYKIHVHV